MQRVITASTWEALQLLKPPTQLFPFGIISFGGVGSHPGRQTLLEGGSNGEAAVVEVVYELRVDGAAELSHLSVSRSDEDALHRFHQNEVKQGVLCTRRQPVAQKQMFYPVCNLKRNMQSPGDLL